MMDEQLQELRKRWEYGRTPVIEIDGGSELMVIATDDGEVHVLFYFQIGTDWNVSSDYSGSDSAKLVKIIDRRFDGRGNYIVTFPKKG